MPVEPPEQSRLLDACKQLPGVVGGGVPGGELPSSFFCIILLADFGVKADHTAGGFDALFLLVIDTAQVLDAVQDLWEGWTEMSVCPLSARQSDGGLVKVDLGQVRGLREGIASWCEKA